MRIMSLHVYPLKSGRSIDLDAAEVTAWGLAGDRRYMVADPAGRFITQRDMQALATITATERDGALHLSMAGRSDVIVATFDPTRRQMVEIWASKVSASIAPDAVNATLSDWLGQDVILVHADRKTERECSHDWSGQGTFTGFSDGFPILITATGSLAALNAATTEAGNAPFGMERFRPNIVVDQDEPFAEDFWQEIVIGGMRFDLVKPCTRCIMTTQDQATGTRNGPDPMPALRSLRLSADRRVAGVLFGWNVIARSTGTLQVGDAVTVTARRTEGWPIRKT